LTVQFNPSAVPRLVNLDTPRLISGYTAAPAAFIGKRDWQTV